VAQAMVFMALDQVPKAQVALQEAGEVSGFYDRWLKRLAYAELARRASRFDEATKLLEGFPITSLHAREEFQQWPQLFHLLEAAGQPVPVPFEYAVQVVVDVRARGPLRVMVNTRSVSIAPTGKAGELLVFLLEQGGAASLEVIAEALYPNVDLAKARKSIWMLVKFLREALGWSSAVIAMRGAYQLDPHAIWQYDVREFRATATQVTDFLPGVYSDWALEVGRELGNLTDAAASIIN
jgi:hypothetical protein